MDRWKIIIEIENLIDRAVNELSNYESDMVLKKIKNIVDDYLKEGKE